MRSRTMKLWNMVTVAAAAAVLSAGVPGRSASAQSAPSRPAAAQVDDDTLESEIEKVLEKDSVLAPRDIDIEASRGQVTLSGSVRTPAEKARAARLAKISGVTSVVNEIEVDPNLDRSKADTAAEKTKAGLNKAVDATVKGVEKAKEGVEKGVTESTKAVGKAAAKTADALDKTGDKMSDASVTTRVKGSLTDEPLLKDTAIDVDTRDHVVTLKGTVPTEAAKTRAGEVAARTEGVSRVVNDLVVRSR
jgi:osmotically-inducible protein OsmY